MRWASGAGILGSDAGGGWESDAGLKEQKKPVRRHICTFCLLPFFYMTAKSGEKRFDLIQCGKPEQIPSVQANSSKTSRCFQPCPILKLQYKRKKMVPTHFETLLTEMQVLVLDVLKICTCTITTIVFGVEM